ncbi:CLUMA_CG011240, isoform A [Clunio marinus]|uniref:CLUMA_CG011240, isoform A n=1 Tax=Clunio marinus TaxID=568069 RepID=A0A1J1IHE6_9DIPT|nr:CLUMA_CG011240, isoform A [Clunio marinus]
MHETEDSHSNDTHFYANIKQDSNELSDSRRPNWLYPMMVMINKQENLNKYFCNCKIETN